MLKAWYLCLCFYFFSLVTLPLPRCFKYISKMSAFLYTGSGHGKDWFVGEDLFILFSLKLHMLQDHFFQCFQTQNSWEIVIRIFPFFSLFLLHLFVCVFLFFFFSRKHSIFSLQPLIPQFLLIVIDRWVAYPRASTEDQFCDKLLVREISASTLHVLCVLCKAFWLDKELEVSIFLHTRQAENQDEIKRCVIIMEDLWKSTHRRFHFE